MLPTDFLEVLYNALLNDKRLKICHCSIYLSLLLLCYKNQLVNPFPVSRKEIMKLAHVNSIVTYHKCIMQLEAYGYILYKPSYSHYKRSTIYLDSGIK